MTQRNEVAEEPRYVAYHWAVILATPFLLLAINPNLFINPNTNVWIDAWVNTGFFLSLPDHLIVWGHSYYSTRLSWLLPGYAAHQIFSPFLANYVLHFGFFYLLLSAVYCLVTAGTNRTTAFIVTLLVAWNPQVIAAMSWDYVDGAVITYFAATLLFIEKASSSVKHWAHWAVAAGAGLTCMVVANLVAATLVPICGLFLLLRVSLPRWRRAGFIVLIAAVGGAATLAILAHTNWQLGGNWLFLKPSVSYASTRMWVPSPWDVQGMSWLADAHVLVLPAAASLGALLALWSRPRSLHSFAGAVQLTFLVAAAWWVIHSSLWTHSIHISYYTSYLVPLGADRSRSGAGLSTGDIRHSSPARHPGDGVGHDWRARRCASSRVSMGRPLLGRLLERARRHLSRRAALQHDHRICHLRCGAPVEQIRPVTVACVARLPVDAVDRL